jgi:hypothetical protein
MKNYLEWINTLLEHPLFANTTLIIICSSLSSLFIHWRTKEATIKINKEQAKASLELKREYLLTEI